MAATVQGLELSWHTPSRHLDGKFLSHYWPFLAQLPVRYVKYWLTIPSPACKLGLALRENSPSGLGQGFIPASSFLLALFWNLQELLWRDRTSKLSSTNSIAMSPR